MEPISLAAAGVGIAGQVKNWFDSDSDEKQALSELKRLRGTPLPRYQTNSAWKRIYQRAIGDISNPTGYTAGERTAFGGRINTALATRFNTASKFGNGRSAAAMDIGDIINAENDFAARDAGLRRDNRNSGLSREMAAAGQFQQTDNANIMAEIQRRLMEEQLLGQAVSSNRGYKRNIVGSVSNDLLTAGTYGLVSGLGKTGSATSTTNSAAWNPTPTRFNRGQANRDASLYNFNDDPYDFTFNDEGYSTGSPVDLRPRRTSFRW